MQSTNCAAPSPVAMPWPLVKMSVAHFLDPVYAALADWPFPFAHRIKAPLLAFRYVALETMQALADALFLVSTLLLCSDTRNI